MRKVLTTLCLVGTASILAMALLAGSAFAAKGPKIKSVKFSGTPSEPTVTIKGKGLGSLPFEAAEPVAECFPEEEVATGNDFGTLAWFEDNSDGWRAGEGAGDCIGLIFSTYTETEVVYHFGSAYSHYPQLVSGDGYTVTLDGLTKTGTVKLKVKKAKEH
jgi:hypothetical protein